MYYTCIYVISLWIICAGQISKGKQFNSFHILSRNLFNPVTQNVDSTVIIAELQNVSASSV